MATIPVNSNAAIIDTNQDAQFVQLANRSLAEIISTGNNVQVYQSKENVYVEAIQVNPTQQYISQNINTVGGGDYEVQYAFEGAFEGSTNFTYDPMSMTLSVPSINTNGNVTISNVSNFHLGGGTAGYFLQTLDGNGTLGWAAGGGGGNGSPGGVTTQIQFNSNGLFAGSSAFTFDSVANKFTLNGTVGNNWIPNANVTYSLGNATNRWKDLYLSNNSLYLGNTKLSTDGSNSINTSDLYINDVRLAQLAITNNPANSTIIIGGNAPAGNVQPIVQLGGNTTSIVQIGSNANANITATNGAITLPNVIGGNFSNVTLNNVVISNANVNSINNGNSNISIPAAGGNVTISVNGIPNIVTTTVNGINVAGTTNVSSTLSAGNLTTAGNTSTANLTATGNVTTANLSATGNVTTANLTATGNVQLGSNANVHITGGSNGQVLTTNGSGNLSWSTVNTSNIANGNSNVSVLANSNVTISVAGNANVFTVTGTGANITGTANVTGNANVGNVGTATLVATTAANVANLNANGAVSFTGSNVSLGAVANLHITGGSNNQFLSTDGAGNLAWANVNQDKISNGNSNVSVSANGNVSTSVAGNANILVVTGTGANITGTANITGNANIGNLGTNTAIITTGNITTVNTGLVQRGTSNVAIAASNGNVTVGVGGTANVLTVTGNANIGTIANAFTSNNYILGNGTTTISTSRWIGASTTATGNSILYELPAANIASVDYHVTSTDSTNSRQVSKLLAVNLGTTTNYVEYGGMWVGPQIADIFVTQAGGNIQLYSNAFTANNIQYNIVMTIYNN